MGWNIYKTSTYNRNLRVNHVWSHFFKYHWRLCMSQYLWQTFLDVYLSKYLHLSDVFGLFWHIYLLAPLYYKTGTMGRIGSTKLVMPNWHKYRSYNRVVRVCSYKCLCQRYWLMGLYGSSKLPFVFEMTSNMIYIVVFGGGLKCPRKIH